MMGGFWCAGVLLVFAVIGMTRAMGLGWLLSTMLALIALVIAIALIAVAVILGDPSFNVS